MSMVGDILRKKRETQQIRLDDVIAQTMISRKYIDGLESGNRDVFPGFVYAKGFLRNYAEYLGFENEDIKELMEQFDNEWQDKEEISIPQESSVKKHKNIYLYWAIFIFLIISLIVLLIFSFKKGGRETLHTDPSKLMEEEDINKVKDFESRSNTKESETKLKMLLKRVTVEAIATEKVWLEVVTDDSKRTEILLNPNQKVKWIGKEKILLTIDNAGGVGFKLNERCIGSLGKSGEMKRVLVTPDGIDWMRVLGTRGEQHISKEIDISKQPQQEIEKAKIEVKTPSENGTLTDKQENLLSPKIPLSQKETIDGTQIH